MFPGYITDVEGIIVGHAHSEDALTGCTAVICPEGATGGVDVRGSAPGTRETDLFKAEKLVDKVHAVVLSGGSAFGLEAASGVMDHLEELGIGFDVGLTRVPIVASAVIFDLAIGDYKVRPDWQMGYKASLSASKDENRQGNVGCGMGATVGKILGPKGAMKSGLGCATVISGDLVVSALICVNAFGDIFKDGSQIAGAYDYGNDSLMNTYELMKSSMVTPGFANTNTTIGVVATNGILTKAEGNKVAQAGHNGLARSINPVHTMVDGDTIFTMATNKLKADVNIIAAMAQEAVEKAVINAILSAEGKAGLKAHRDLTTKVL